MKTLSTAIRAFVQDEGGATAIEYGLIVAVIAAGLATVLTAINGNLTSAFTYVRDQLAAAIPH